MATTVVTPQVQKTVQQIAKEKAALSNQYLESVDQEADAAQQAQGRLEKASQDAVAATRADTGRVLANTRGMLGGGRGLAVMRGAALQRGTAEGAQRAQYAGQIQEAVQQAARAKSEALAEHGKALQAKELEQQQAATASSKAEEHARLLAEDYVGWLSDANRREIAQNMRNRAALQPSAGEQQAWLAMADNVERGMELGQIG